MSISAPPTPLCRCGSCVMADRLAVEQGDAGRAGASARAVDRIDLPPRATAHDVIRLNNMHRGSAPLDVLRAVLVDRLAGDIALVSSFGAESAILLDLAARIDPAVPVLFLDTGKHFPETLAYRDEIAARRPAFDFPRGTTRMGRQFWQSLPMRFVFGGHWFRLGDSLFNFRCGLGRWSARWLAGVRAIFDPSGS